MSLPAIQLDDRSFQELVSEARMRIARTCPEWSEHNVSDPGITLIELFAWMTEMTIYRVNRVPDKLHVALLELLGIQLTGPTPARTDLRFLLAQPLAAPVRIAAAEAEIGTVRTATEDSVVFTLDEDFVVPSERPVAYVLSRDGRTTDVPVIDGTALPLGADQLVFAADPVVGDAFALGFDVPLGRLVVEVEVKASDARAPGVDSDDPPLVWEVSQADDTWLECDVLDDQTGGFEFGSGTVRLQLPPTSGVTRLAQHRYHWLRCRYADRTRTGAVGAFYTRAPEVRQISAGAIGALLPATHALRVDAEILGSSDGTPSQRFRVKSAPVLAPELDETLEVQDPTTGAWTAWQHCSSFAESGADDPHYRLDLVTGAVELGPAIREADGSWTQKGRVPPAKALLRATYRHGGGRRGNVAAGTLTVIRRPIARVDAVSNPLPATGGADAEDLDHARLRASHEIRARSRAVTAADFEFLAREASPRIARAACLAADDGVSVRVLVLPGVDDADRLLDRSELEPDAELLAEVARFLDERRLIGTRVRLLPFRLRALSVAVQVRTEPHADDASVRNALSAALYRYMNPLIGGNPDGVGEGWPLGRRLTAWDIHTLVGGVPGVDSIRQLSVYEADLRTGQKSPRPSELPIILEPDEVIVSVEHSVKVRRAATAR